LLWPLLKSEDESIKNKLFDIFSKDVRSRTALAVFLMAMQQLSGIDGALYLVGFSTVIDRQLIKSFQHAPSLFKQAGLASADASVFAPVFQPLSFLQ
jgi:DNA-directed RNA polymerase III subunit RPC2